MASTLASDSTSASGQEIAPALVQALRALESSVKLLASHIERGLGDDSARYELAAELEYLRRAIANVEGLRASLGFSIKSSDQATFIDCKAQA